MVRDDSLGDRGGDEPDPAGPCGEAGHSESPTHDVAQILSRIEHGDGQAAEQLLPLVYEELRKLAAAKIAQEKPDQTLQATALVHEAYIRLVDVEQARHWNSRGHFFCAAAEAMRRILITNARRRKCQIRGGDQPTMDVNVSDIPDPLHSDRLLALDEALLAEQKKLAGRAVPPDETLTHLLTALDQRGGKMTSTALAKNLAVLPFRLRGLLAVVQRILNMDGFAVFTRDEASDTLELNRELLIRQFDLTEE